MEDKLGFGCFQKAKKKKKRKSLKHKFSFKKRILVDLENSAQTLYQHTADARAERALLLWYAIQLSWITKDNEEEKPFFEGI